VTNELIVESSYIIVLFSCAIKRENIDEMC
jgi:hypothetical protein